MYTLDGPLWQLFRLTTVTAGATKIVVFRYPNRPYIIAPTLTVFFRVFRALLPEK